MTVSVRLPDGAGALTLRMRGAGERTATMVVSGTGAVVLSVSYDRARGAARVMVEQGGVGGVLDAEGSAGRVGCGGESAAFLDGIVLAYAGDGDCPAGDAAPAAYSGEAVLVLAAPGFSGTVADLPGALAGAGAGLVSGTDLFVVEGGGIRTRPGRTIPAGTGSAGSAGTGGELLITARAGGDSASLDFVVRVSVLVSPELADVDTSPRVVGVLTTVRPGEFPADMSFAQDPDAATGGGIAVSGNGVLVAAATLAAGTHTVNMLAGHDSFLGSLTLQARVRATGAVFVYPSDLLYPAQVLTVVGSDYTGAVFTITTESGVRDFGDFGTADLTVSRELVFGGDDFVLGEDGVVTLARALASRESTARVRISATGGRLRFCRRRILWFGGEGRRSWRLTLRM